MRIIDCHCHAGKGNGLNGPWDTEASLNRFLLWSEKAGIHRTNLFAALNEDGYSKANLEVARIVKSNPKKFSGFVFVHCAIDKGQIFKMVEKMVLEYGFRGIKAHRQDARLTREVCETARYFDLPILYDVMGETSAVELLATQYPEVNFIIPHLSSFADDWNAQLNFIPLLKRHRNVYTDTSGVKRFDMLEMAVRQAGPHKILFGTDGPWLHPAVELEKIFMLELPEEYTQWILADNFLRISHKA